MENDFKVALAKLEIEYEGIRRTVRRYTTEGLITNYFEQLKQAISQHNIRNIKYCLSAINKWYKEKIQEIGVLDSYNIDSHLNAMSIIAELDNAISIIPNDYIIQSSQKSNE